LRREEVAVEPDPQEVDLIATPDAVEETPLDPVAAATAALEADPASPPRTEPQPAAPAPAPPAPAPAQSSLSKPFIQVGIFSVEANANRTAQQMRNAGMVPTVRRSEIGGKPFWRVVVGPARSSAARADLLEKIRGEGFTDAYPVAN